MMKRFLLLLPLLLTACGGAADITTNEPFQITCVDKFEDVSSTDKWFIDPTLDKAVTEWSYKDETGEQEYKVKSINPKKIVLGSDWGYMPEDSDGSGFDLYTRTRFTIDRFTGEMTRQYFEYKARNFPSESFDGNEVQPEVGESYECEKPTRG